MSATLAGQEGGLVAPTRHPIPWQTPEFHDRAALDQELLRVFAICHGCRRCVSLCNAFPTLFALVDAATTQETDGVARGDYQKVVDACYLCDLCYLTKCPYVPPHPWNVDFPHLMLRAKAVKFRSEGATLRDRILTSPLEVGRIAGIPVVAAAVNFVSHSPVLRGLVEKTLDIHHAAPLPDLHADSFAKREARRAKTSGGAKAGELSTGKVGIFVTCYGNHNEPALAEDLQAVFAHNEIYLRVVGLATCCGMPKLELGDLEAVAVYKDKNLPALLALVAEGYALVAPVPSCTLMFRQELPLLFPEDPGVRRVAAAFRDPFEYLWLRHKEGLLRTDFTQALGSVLYHAACHQRVQRIGPKTREVLELVPGTEVRSLERCSGHDGSYALKRESYDHARRIGRPVVTELARAAPDHFVSDCPMAARFIATGGELPVAAVSAFRLLRIAYGI